jgi:6,7-dimethyl-8-ribityllumazine synthase
MRTVDGSPSASGLRVAIVVSKYHAFVPGRLQTGSLAALEAAGVTRDGITIVRVPGSFELPSAAQHAAEGGYDAVVCLGCLIKGETPHSRFIASAVAQGLTAAAATTGVPMALGVLTTNSVEEVLARAGRWPGQQRVEAAVAAVEMATVIRQLRKP